MSISTLAEDWKKFMTACYPEGINGTQREETEKAFMAGAFIGMQKLIAVGAAAQDTEEGEIDAARLVAMLDDEAREFLAQKIKEATLRNRQN